MTRVDSSVPTSVERSRLRREKEKLQKKKKFPASDALTRGQKQKARAEQENTRQGRRTEPARLYPQRTPDSKRLTQAKHERNQAVLPMRLGLDSTESARSRTKSLARSRAMLASSSEETRASKESHEPVPYGRGEAGLEETHPVCRREIRHLAVQSVQHAVFFEHHFMHDLGCVQRWHVVRLPRVAARAVRRSVRERAGCRGC